MRGGPRVYCNMGTVIPKRPCAHAGCREWASPGRSYCPRHQEEFDRAREEARRKNLAAIEARREEYRKNADKRRPNASRRGYNSAWSRARKAYIIRHPICAVCGKPATDIDHIIPHKGDKTLFWDSTNWQPLCHECHARKTYEENRERFQLKTKKEKPKQETVTDERMGILFIP